MQSTSAGLTRIKWRMRPPRGPLGTVPGGVVYKSNTGCNAIVAREDGKLHVSVSHPRREPTGDEISTIRERQVPDHATMAIILPPRERYVNLHEYCFHLFEIDADG